MKTAEEWIAWRNRRRQKKEHDLIPVGVRRRSRKYNHIFVRDKGICQLCWESIRYEEGTLDHIVPYSHGGEGVPRNLQLTHSHCNLIKGNEYACDCGLPSGAPGCRKGIERGWKKYADNLENRMQYMDWKYNGGPLVKDRWVP